VECHIACGCRTLFKFQANQSEPLTQLIYSLGPILFVILALSMRTKKK
jgi:hypothetical protein